MEIYAEKVPWVSSFKSPNKCDDNGHLLPLLGYDSLRKRITNSYISSVPIDKKKDPLFNIYKKSAEEGDSEETPFIIKKKQQ